MTGNMTARHSDPETSHEAGAGAQPLLPHRQRNVLKLLKLHGPMHDEALVRLYEEESWKLGGPPTQSESGIRSRRAELVKLGLVRDTGMRTKTQSGRKAVVWEATS